MASMNEGNRRFWNEACGTVLARDVGAVTQDKESFAEFDAAYFDLYPFLKGYLPLAQMSGHTVLEIGLGYGSVSQQLAQTGAEYIGLDIASGPVAIVHERLRINELQGNVLKGNALNLPFSDNHFDYVVSIGCLHHTGDTARALSEVRRVLKPGGVAVVMVYNALCYKNWIIAPLETLKMLTRTLGKAKGSGSATLRLAHDRDSTGDAPPETAFFSIGELKQLFSDFDRTSFRKENCYLRLPMAWRRLRHFALKTVGRLCGLNIYAIAVK